jgi:predicted CopG family antitoxin
MLKELTISVEEDVYNELLPLIEQKTINSFIANAIRPKISDAYLNESYKALAEDTEREKTALLWCNSLIGEMSNE